MNEKAEVKQQWLRVCGDPRSSTDMLEKAAYWEAINCPKEFSVRICVARHKSTTAELLTRLSHVDHLPLLIAVAEHPNLSEKTAGKMLKSHLRALRKQLARNPKIPAYVMEKLAKDFVDVRVELAKNPNLPLKIQENLAKTKHEAVQLTLARNPKLSTQAFDFFVLHSGSKLKEAVLENPNLPLSHLRHLAGDPEASVAQKALEVALKRHPMDHQIFTKFASSSNSETRAKAKDHLSFLESIIECESSGTSPQIQEKLQVICQPSYRVEDVIDAVQALTQAEHDRSYTEMEKNKEPQVVFFGHFDYSPKSRVAFMLTCHALRLRLYQAYKRVKGLDNMRILDRLHGPPNPNFKIFVGFKCPKDQEDTLSELINKEVNRLRSGSLPPPLVEEVMDSLLRQWEVRLYAHFSRQSDEDPGTKVAGPIGTLRHFINKTVGWNPTRLELTAKTCLNLDTMITV